MGFFAVLTVSSIGALAEAQPAPPPVAEAQANTKAPDTSAPATPADPERQGAAEARAPDAAPEPDPLARPPQDYETRHERPPVAPERARSYAEPPSVETEDLYLLLPRVVLYPVNLVLKLVALPLRGAAIAIDRYHLIEHTKDILYNDARTAGVLPAFGYQSGYGFTYGLKAFHNDLFGNDEELNVAAAFGGIYTQGYGMSFVGDQIAHTPLWVEARSRFEVKPGLYFQGFGDETVSDEVPGVGPREAHVPTRFKEDRILAELTVGASIGELGNRSRLGLTGLYNHRNFDREHKQEKFDEPSIETVYDTAQIPGFEQGSDVFELTPTFIYDSRNQESTPSDGVYLDLFGGHSVPVNDAAEFWHYGAQFATFLDLYKGTRVLGFRGMLEAVHGDDEQIPFADMIKLGGPVSLRGYPLDRYRDKLAASGTIEYRYPVHQMVSGELFFDFGRVGQSYTEVFDREGLKDFHYGGGLGFVFHNEDKIFFKAQVAYGEDVFFFLSTDPLRTFRRRDKRL